MKTLNLLLLLFLIGVSKICSAQLDVKDFYGIPFGSTKSLVISEMKKKGYNQQPGASKYLTFNKVRFGVRTAYSASFYFYNDKLYKGLFLFIPDVEYIIHPTYVTMAEEITKKYGEGVSTEDYTSPFKKGDGHFLKALKSDKLKITTIWTKESGEIELSIAPTTLISISYLDIKLNNEAYDELKAKTNSDL